ncbi:chain length determinant protein EpsF [Methylococcus capsulatus]|uniref:chain length determinant protein EpsF n=1 Tax=Methylococcus capsulatus TaxID=414 RepID=UPI001C52AC58|nr:chain length determinant protein EpsF [Methylococcus capsulatus]QXP89424.1 chain length determinant protein EpsF [Methylococcus capsulatus]QXP93971.1 chain length determinant protein EpsF [Methylococcus capsulatus]UQN11297.1 chain length determinant protein EpsF [Methylococcus capsulatus]
MSANRLILIFLARWRVFGWTLAVTVLTTLVASVAMSKTYTASTTVVIDYKGGDPLTGSAFPSDLMAGYLATQVDIIGSHAVAARVADALKLSEVPAYRDRFEKVARKTGSRAVFRDWAADRLLEDLDVSPSRESDVITISFAASDPLFAADVADAFAQTSIRANVELKLEPLKRQAAWFDEQVLALRSALEKAQAELSSYQIAHGVLAAGDKLDVETAHLSDLSAQLAAAKGQMYDGEARVQQVRAAARGGVDALPDLLQNPALQALKAELARAEARLAEVGSRYDWNHPQRRAVAAEVASLRQRLAAEVANATGAIERAAELARQRVADLERAVVEQRKRILALGAEQDKLSVLKREVENAQRVYDAALQRASQLQLESRLEGTNIVVLSPAVPPLKPSKPKVALNLALSVILGSGLGLAFVLLFEFKDRRIRSAEDVIDELGLPLLAEMPPERTAWPRFFRLAAPSALKG